MGYDDDFPHLAEEKRAHRVKVAMTTVGILGGLALAVLKISEQKQREDEIRGMRALDEAMHDYHATPAPAPANRVDTSPDREPIELTLTLGTRSIDVDGDPIAIGDGRSIVLERAADWTFVGTDFSFSYPSSVRVSTHDGVLLTSSEANAEVHVVDSTASDAKDLADMTALYTGTGQVESQQRATLTLFGKPARGTRLAAAGLVFEVYSVKLDRKRRFRVAVVGTSARADLEPVRGALETVTRGAARPTPEFTLVVRDGRGGELESHDLAIGGTVAIAGGAAGTPPIEVALARRPLVKEHLSGMTFEHPPELIAIALVVGTPAVQLRTGEIGIQLMVPPFSASAQEALDAVASGGVIDEQKPVEVAMAGATYKGIRGRMTMGTFDLAVEVLPFTHDGKDFVATLQFPAGSEAEAHRLAAPVLASVE